MKNWRTGTPIESGDYYVVVRYGSREGFNGIYSEARATFDKGWKSVDVDANWIDEVVKWMPLEEAKGDICLKCKHGYRPSEKNLLEVWCMARTKREDACIFEADTETGEKQI